MAGNVNEWTADTYRQTSFEETDDFNPFRGNEFTNKQYSDPAKGLYAKDKYGKPVLVAGKSNKKQTWAEMNAGMPAGTGGSTTASIQGANGTAGVKNSLAGKPYSADQRGYADTVSNSLYGITTLVNDRSKVYKGGSWNDRAYFLNPSTRRFMDQGDAAAEIGFRCAMNYEGPPEINPGGKPQYSVKKAKPFNAKKP